MATREDGPQKLEGKGVPWKVTRVEGGWKEDGAGKKEDEPGGGSVWILGGVHIGILDSLGFPTLAPGGPDP